MSARNPNDAAGDFATRVRRDIGLLTNRYVLLADRGENWYTATFVDDTVPLRGRHRLRLRFSCEFEVVSKFVRGVGTYRAARRVSDHTGGSG